jgi:hypothetical protein
MLERVVPNQAARSFERAEQTPHSGSDRRTVTRTSATSYEPHDSPGPGDGLSPEKSLHIGSGFEDGLAMQIEGGVRVPVGPIGHR